MKLSQSSEKYQGFTIFWKKCKQTAEISWLFIWDVKISKKLFKQSFGIFYSHVRTYLGLRSPTTQWPKFLCQYPCFVINPIYIWPGCRWQIFYISLSTTQFWIFWKKFPNKHCSTLAKFEKTSKQVENQQIFIITLTKKFSVADYWYMLYKFTQHNWALSLSLICHI